MDSSGKKRIGFSFALNGIKHVVLSERNFRLQLLALLAVIVLSALLSISAVEWMILLLVSSNVLVAEMLNTAIEHLIDYMKPDIHPIAKIIKDVAAGAVLLASLTSIIIGSIIFIPKLLDLM